MLGGVLLWKVHRTNMVRAAKADFICAFYTVLEGVYPRQDPNREIFESLRNSQAGLNRAVAIFRFYVPKSKLKKFDQSWETYNLYYRSCTKENQTVHLFYGEGDGPYEKLCKRIDEVLSYAKT